MKSYVFTAEIRGGIFDVKPAVTEAMAFVEKHAPRLNTSDGHEIKLVICELLFNAVIHGNKSDGRKKVSFSLMIERSGDEAFVSGAITDEGQGFDHKAVMRDMNTREAIMRENGRGIKLAYELTNQLVYSPAGNSVSFRKKLAAKAFAEAVLANV